METTCCRYVILPYWRILFGQLTCLSGSLPMCPISALHSNATGWSPAILIPQGVHLYMRLLQYASVKYDLFLLPCFQSLDTHRIARSWLLICNWLLQPFDWMTTWVVCPFHFPLIDLTVLPVVILTAVGYDYSKRHISVWDSSFWMNLNIVSPHISKGGMPQWSVWRVRFTVWRFPQIEYIWVRSCFSALDRIIQRGSEKTLDMGIYLVCSCAYSDHPHHAVLSVNRSSFQARYFGLYFAMYVYTSWSTHGLITEWFGRSSSLRTFKICMGEFIELTPQ